MGFKLKHVFKGPTKVLNAVGNAGILGQRGDHFRILGVKIGKDLVPVVQTAAIVATANVIGPVLSGLTPAATTITSTAISSSVVTGLSGGNESSVTNAAVSGAINSGTNIIAGTESNIIGQTIIKTVGNITADIVTNNDVNVASSIVNAVCDAILPHNETSSFVKGVITAAVTNDNPLRSGLQNTASTYINNKIQDLFYYSAKHNKHCIEELESSKWEHIDSLYLIKYQDSFSDNNPIIKEYQIEQEEKIINVKVARRRLRYKISLPQINLFAHSGVIVETNKNNKYLLEFMDDETVHKTTIDNNTSRVTETLDTHQKMNIITDGKSEKWNVQKNGCRVSKNLTVESAMKIMKFDMYSLKDNKICHSAQEKLRSEVCDN